MRVMCFNLPASRVQLLPDCNAILVTSTPPSSCMPAGLSALFLLPWYLNQYRQCIPSSQRSWTRFASECAMRANANTVIQVRELYGDGPHVCHDQCVYQLVCRGLHVCWFPTGQSMYPSTMSG
jgi:hypothetical protein